MLILAFDTSTRAISVALLEDERPFAELTFAVDRHHSETLLAAIDHLLRLSGREISQVELLSCTVGPGSFTGLRIGVATAKGLAFARSIPIAGISTLEALAVNQVFRGIPVCPLLDAKKNQVYCGLYQVFAEGPPEILISDRLLAIAEIMAEIQAPTIFVGDGAIKYRVALQQTLAEKALFAPSFHNRITAVAVGISGFRRYQEGKVCNAGSLKPIYLRPQSGDYGP